MTEHFGGKSAAEHVLEKRGGGAADAAEAHGAEAPGHLISGADAARDTSVALLLLWIVLQGLGTSVPITWLVLGAFGLGWLVWKGGRSAQLAWGRLERLHRIIQQEKWEIEHHRGQEREELEALYRLKGFEGKLLDDVLDVLMADNDRLLKVMLEEEMGLTLSVYEHPLKQAAGAALGVLCTLTICGLGFICFPHFGIPAGSLLTLAGSALIIARAERNQTLPAIVWTLALGASALVVGHFFIQWLSRNFTAAA